MSTPTSSRPPSSRTAHGSPRTTPASPRSTPTPARAWPAPTSCWPPWTPPASTAPSPPASPGAPPERCAAHASDLLEAAAASGGRLLPFLPVPTAFLLEAERAPSEARDWLAPLIERGAGGLGEIRLGGGPAAPSLEQQVEAAARLAALLEGHDLPLLVHASEDVGHAYPGKAGGFTPGGLWRLLEAHPVRVIAAHWAPACPSPRSCPSSARSSTRAGSSSTPPRPRCSTTPPSSSASPRSQAPSTCCGASDFPLRDIATDRAAAEAALPDPELRAAVLGGNAARFLGLA